MKPVFAFLLELTMTMSPRPRFTEPFWKQHTDSERLRVELKRKYSLKKLTLLLKCQSENILPDLTGLVWEPRLGLQGKSAKDICGGSLIPGLKGFRLWKELGIQYPELVLVVGTP